MQPDELTDAVVHMDYPVAGLEVRVDGFRGFSVEYGAPAGLRAAPTENLTIGEQMLLDFAMLQHPTAGDGALDETLPGVLNVYGRMCFSPELLEPGSLTRNYYPG